MSINKDETLLVFRIAGIPFAVPAQSVDSILMPPTHITHAPGSHRSTPGIFHHAEYTYAIIDLHERFGIDTPRTGSGRLLLHEEGIRHFAFLVDTVVGLVRSEQGRWASLPHYLPQELFSVGFLYQNEIVLCSELTLLRNMHDVEPLRRHFEQLQQKNEKTASVSTTTTTTPPTESSDKVKKPETKPEPPPTPPVEKKQPDAVSPLTPMQQHRSATPVTRQPSASATVPSAQSASVIHRPTQATTPRTATTAQQSPPTTPVPPATTVPASPPPTTPPRRPAPANEDSSLLWLVLFLLLLGAIPLGYWLWPKPAREQLPPPVTLQESPPVNVAEEVPADAPLRIERDGDGTINMIIDRMAIANAHEPAAKQEPSVDTEKSQSREVIEKPQQEPIVEDSVQAEITQPEPCDCTHIVVKGDTLWDIAEQYTGDAFNYPQLAKRSGIKNPDRIYPGDRVRIIIR